MSTHKKQKTNAFGSQALLSVFDKKGIEDLGQNLSKAGVSIISTGGTSKKLQNAGIKTTEVADITKFPELLEGRVKTLHPNIHAGLLAKTNSDKHVTDLEKHGINPIQLVAVNLYPFEETIKKPDTTLDIALENIDIGGVALLRAAAKNFHFVIVIVDPNDYSWITERIQKGGFDAITFEERKSLALKAFQHVCAYDAAISKYLAGPASDKSPSVILNPYIHQFDLKYGVNPHQKPAAIYAMKGNQLPFTILNGKPGYINFMDALNAWQLVKELRKSTNKPAAASFKHVSPAGAAVAVPLTDEEKKVYEVGDKKLTDLAVAYIRARNADPMSSFGDFAAVSDIVDEETAVVLKAEVSDGIIAPGFDAKALEILKQKKKGNYIIMQMDPNYEAPETETRELYGIVMSQKRNDVLITKDHLNKIVTQKKDLTEEAKIDLLVASIALKYTQSNSVGYAYHGQMIGVGAGQQSRVDCAKLAGSKVKNWWLRFHENVKDLPFKSGAKRTERNNTRIHYIDDNLSPTDKEILEKVPDPLTDEEQKEWMKKLNGVSMSSDAFFPFRDSIDVAANLGVKYIAQPGGSIQDEGVKAACDEYGMAMCLTDVRLFHH